MSTSSSSRYLGMPPPSLTPGERISWPGSAPPSPGGRPAAAGAASGGSASPARLRPAADALAPAAAAAGNSLSMSSLAAAAVTRSASGPSFSRRPAWRPSSAFAGVPLEPEDSALAFGDGAVGRKPLPVVAKPQLPTVRQQQRGSTAGGVRLESSSAAASASPLAAPVVMAARGGSSSSSGGKTSSSRARQRQRFERAAGTQRQQPGVGSTLVFGDGADGRRPPASEPVLSPGLRQGGGTPGTVPPGGRSAGLSSRVPMPDPLAPGSDRGPSPAPTPAPAPSAAAPHTLTGGGSPARQVNVSPGKLHGARPRRLAPAEPAAPHQGGPPPLWQLPDGRMSGGGSGATGVDAHAHAMLARKPDGVMV